MTFGIFSKKIFDIFFKYGMIIFLNMALDIFTKYGTWYLIKIRQRVSFSAIILHKYSERGCFAKVREPYLLFYFTHECEENIRMHAIPKATSAKCNTALSNPHPNPLADQLWCIDFLTPPTALIIPHRLPAFLESLMPLKIWCSIHARCSKSSLKYSIRFWGIFPSLKQNFIAYRSSKVSSSPDCIFEIHQLWQSDFSRVRSNCCCSCLFELEIIRICQSSHKMYSNNILNFQESMTILDTWTKMSVNLLKAPRIYVYIGPLALVPETGVQSQIESY